MLLSVSPRSPDCLLPSELFFPQYGIYSRSKIFSDKIGRIFLLVIGKAFVVISLVEMFFYSSKAFLIYKFHDHLITKNRILFIYHLIFSAFKIIFQLNTA